MRDINGEVITTKWYQNNAMRTLNTFESCEALKLNAYFGIIGEYGEFFDYIKKLYTHNLTEEKKVEVRRLAPKELGDVVWYLTTSLAVYFDYSLDEVYDVIVTEKKGSSYYIDDIYDYVDSDNNEDIFIRLMYFKKVLNKIDDVKTKEEAVETVALVLIRIAEILKDLFGMNLSEVLYLNIDKLRKRYPNGFSTEVSNVRIDANSKYKEEEDYKIYRK